MKQVLLFTVLLASLMFVSWVAVDRGIKLTSYILKRGVERNPTMNEVTDIRQDPEVRRVVKEMRGPAHDWVERSQSGGCCWCRNCHEEAWPPFTHHQVCPHNKPITMSIGDLAFFMRDKCETNEWEIKLAAIRFSNRAREPRSTPEEWIRAACAAWRMK